MTKAEKIYQDTRRDCLKHINEWGFQDVGFNAVTYGDDEHISRKTINEINKIYERNLKELVIRENLGVITREKAIQESQVLRMIRLTIDNTSL